MPVVSKKLEEIDVVATTEPFASVASNDDGSPRMAKFVVVALVVVALVAMMLVKVEFAVVEVAVKLGAVTVLYAVTRLLKSELPTTSKMLPVVDVAVVPRRVT